MLHGWLSKNNCFVVVFCYLKNKSLNKCYTHLVLVFVVISIINIHFAINLAIALIKLIFFKVKKNGGMFVDFWSLPYLMKSTITL